MAALEDIGPVCCIGDGDDLQYQRVVWEEGDT
jgi:hypothetical protein